MNYCNDICARSYNIIKSTLLHSRRYCIVIIRLIILCIICLLLLYFSSVQYYSFYCTNRFQQGLIEADKRGLWNIRRGVREEFIPILMPVCDRPHYLRRVIDGLSKVDGINEVIKIKIENNMTHSFMFSTFRHLSSFRKIVHNHLLHLYYHLYHHMFIFSFFRILPRIFLYHNMSIVMNMQLQLMLNFY